MSNAIGLRAVLYRKLRLPEQSTHTWLTLWLLLYSEYPTAAANGDPLA
jgi:hypothetical protein